ncbi:MAG: SPFH domain-containing protein [Myxococcaceae bacterium]|nr:SPFH domain-containing protein [Myxococcaceae bacterium]MCI0670061.1 SPFH domain-containing protein [Myxococcaceae bacterium]
MEELLDFSLPGVLLGVGAFVVVRYVLTGFFTVDQNERAVKTSFGRAQRLLTPGHLENPVASSLAEAEKERYRFPQLRVIPPGGPYFKWPWERVHKVSVATQTVNMAFDPESRSANQGGTVLEAVTKDQLNVGLTGQLRYRVSEQNLYAYLFGVRNPIAHVMGFFISILRERIANFEAPPAPRALPLPEDATVSPVAAAAEVSLGTNVSINDLRKNLRDINEHMQRECRASGARYGMVLDSSLITGIDPPQEVESALAAINTAHNHVSSDISLAHAEADQKIVQSRRAVEIETLRAHAEVEPLTAMAAQLADLKRQGSGALAAYLRNVRLSLYGKARQVILEVKR